MELLQPDFSGNVRCYVGDAADREIMRIFGFRSTVFTDAARNALRAVTESDDMHAQLSAEGSRFYHAFVEGVREEIDMLDDWSANREADNQTSPRAYRADGLTLAFAQGNSATGDESKNLGLKRLGKVTLFEIRRSNDAEQQELDFDELPGEAQTRPQTLWLLVYKRDGDKVSIEVSLPVVSAEDDTIIGWDKRLILGEITWNTVIVEATDDERRNEDGDAAIAVSAG